MSQTESTIEVEKRQELYETLAPDVGIEKHLASGRNGLDGVKDLVENAIAAAGENGKTEVTISLHLDQEDELILVADDAGGMADNNVHHLTKYSSSETDDTSSMHTFGTGGTIGIRTMAMEAKILTQYEAEQEIAAREIVSKTQNVDSWDDINLFAVEVEDWPNEADAQLDGLNLGRGCTLIEMTNLKVQFNDEDIDSLKNDLQNRFRYYLRNKGWQDLSVNIVVNGDKITPPEAPNFVYPPYVSPRKYKRLPVPNFEECIAMDVTVGLLSKDDKEKAGVWYACNGMGVGHFSEGDHEAGMQSGGCMSSREGLERLYVKIHFKALQDPDRLPWNGEKEFSYGEVVRNALSRVSTITEAYRKAQHLPDPLLDPFTKDSEGAMRGGEIWESEPYDETYSKLRKGERVAWNGHGNNNVYSKLKTGMLKQLKRDERFLISTAEKALENGWFPEHVSASTAKNWYNTALKNLLTSETEGYWRNNTDEKPDKLTKVSSENLVDIKFDYYHRIASAIEERAEADKCAELGKRFTGVPDFCHPLYEQRYESAENTQLYKISHAETCWSEIEKAKLHARFLVRDSSEFEGPEEVYNLLLLIYSNSSHMRYGEIWSELDTESWEFEVEDLHAIDCVSDVSSIDSHKTRHGSLSRNAKSHAREGYKKPDFPEKCELPLYRKHIEHFADCEYSELEVSVAENVEEESDEKSENECEECTEEESELLSKPYRDLQDVVRQLDGMMGTLVKNTRHESIDEAVGRMAEEKLRVEENNDVGPDIPVENEGDIEIKAHRHESGREGYVTLTSKNPNTDYDKVLSNQLIIDNGNSNKVNNASLNSPLKLGEKNNNNMWMEIEGNYLIGYAEVETDAGVEEYEAFQYALDDVVDQLESKLSRLLLLKAQQTTINGKKHFVYDKAVLYEDIEVSNLGKLIKKGVITVEPRKHIDENGNPDGHGTRWCIKEKKLEELFSSSRTLIDKTSQFEL